MAHDDIIHVPPQSPRKVPCKIAFLGEAPGEEELRKGAPFVGPAGKIFNAMLRTAELDREDYWIGNVFDQKIPKNDLAEWCKTKAEAQELGWDTSFPFIPGYGHLDPAYRHHLPRLAAELAAVRPNVVVPLGGTALWALTGQSAIATYRGGLMMGNVVGSQTAFKVLPSFHPAFVMRQWKFFSVVVGDFIKAAAEADKGPELTLPKKSLIIRPSLSEFEAFAEVCKNTDVLSVDIETGWNQITCIGFAPSAQEAICVPFIDLSKPNKSYWNDPVTELRAWEIVRDILEHPVPKLGQNFAGYDFYWLLERYGIKVRNLLHDTRLLHHALYPELPKSLEFMGGSYTNQGPWKQYSPRKQEKRDD